MSKTVKKYLKSFVFYSSISCLYIIRDMFMHMYSKLKILIHYQLIVRVDRTN